VICAAAAPFLGGPALVVHHTRATEQFANGRSAVGPSISASKAPDIRPGPAYTFLEGDGGEGIPVGLLKARTALVFNTSNTPVDREDGDPLELIWKRRVFGSCGVTDVRRVTFSVVVTSSREQRKRWLVEARELVDACFPAGQ